MEIAGLHNIRANLRYYNKKKQKTAISDAIEKLNRFIAKVNEADGIQELMLLEARGRETYYFTFNNIIEQQEFRFERRIKRPPRDELNAMISFGNTLLYNQFLQIIWKTSLDPRIGIIHASNRRSHSLNLDFADLFKPVIVDRVIFTLINCQQIKKEKHFVHVKENGVYLNKEGKKLFIEVFERKLAAKKVVRGEKYTYKQLMENEVRKYQKYLLQDEKYKPYKYY